MVYSPTHNAMLRQNQLEVDFIFDDTIRYNGSLSMERRFNIY